MEAVQPAFELLPAERFQFPFLFFKYAFQTVSNQRFRSTGRGRTGRSVMVTESTSKQVRIFFALVGGILRNFLSCRHSQRLSVLEPRWPRFLEDQLFFSC